MPQFTPRTSTSACQTHNYPTVLPCTRTDTKARQKKTSTVLKSHLAGPPVSLSASPPRSRRGYPPLCRQIVSSCEATPRAHHLAARAVRLFVPAAVCVRKKLSRSRLFIPAASVRSTARRDFRATVLSTGRRHSISLLLSTGTL